MRQRNPKTLTRIDDNHFTYGEYEITLARPPGKKSKWIATVKGPKETWTTEGHGQRVAFVKQVATAIDFAEWQPSKNPCTLEKGDLFVGTYEDFGLTRSGYQRSTIDGYTFLTLFELRDPPAGVKTWNDVIGRLVVFEYRGPVESWTIPLATIRAVVSPDAARSYGRWSGREEEQFEIERRGGQAFKRKNPDVAKPWMNDAARRLARGE